MSIHLDYVNQSLSISLDDCSIHVSRDDNGLITSTVFASDRIIDKHVHSCFFNAVENITFDRDSIKDRLIKKSILAFDDYFRYSH